MISSRVQAISESSAVKAVTARSASAVGRSQDGPSLEIGTGWALTTCGSGSSDRAMTIAVTPSARLTNAVDQRVAWIPIRSVRKNPASAVPATAPKVLRL